MKRIIAILLAGAFLLAGCQAKGAPADAPQMNAEKVVQMAAESNSIAVATPVPQQSLTQRYGIPDRLNLNLRSESGKVKIAVNAAVSAPEKPLPVLRVEPIQFSQEIVDDFYHALIGDTPMFETDSRRTKAFIQQDIDYYQSVLNDEAAADWEKDAAGVYLAQCEAEYASAPESTEPVPADSTLKLQTEKWDEGRATTHYSGVDIASADKQYHFYVRNDRDNTSVIIEHETDKDGTKRESGRVPVSRNAYINYSRNMETPTYNYSDDTIRLERDEMLPEHAAKTLRLSPEAAASSAEEILTSVGLGDGFGVSDIYLVSDYHAYEQPTATGYGYRVICTRRIDDQPTAYIHNVNGSALTMAGDPDGAFWGYESIMMEMDDNGLLFLSWNAPLGVMETVGGGHVELKPFSEITEIARKILPLTCEPGADTPYTQIDVKIDRVTLSLQRIAEQSRFDRGFLVPVWNFFGACTKSWQDNDGPASSFTEFGSMLSINAIDGSIIDVRQGY